MSKLRVVTFAILLLLVVAVGCSSSDQAAIDKAVSATLTAAQPANAAPTATSTPEPLPTDTTVPELTATPNVDATIAAAISATSTANSIISTAVAATVTPAATATSAPTPLPVFPLEIDPLSDPVKFLKALPAAEVSCAADALGSEERFAEIIQYGFGSDRGVNVPNDAESDVMDKCLSEKTVAAIFSNKIFGEVGGISENTHVCIREKVEGYPFTRLFLENSPDSDVFFSVLQGLFCLNEQERSELSQSEFLGLNELSEIGGLDTIECLVNEIGPLGLEVVLDSELGQDVAATSDFLFVAIECGAIDEAEFEKEFGVSVEQFFCVLGEIDTKDGLEFLSDPLAAIADLSPIELLSILSSCGLTLEDIAGDASLPTEPPSTSFPTPPTVVPAPTVPPVVKPDTEILDGEATKITKAPEVPLLIAIQNEDLETVLAHISYGTDLNDISSGDGLGTLHLAVLGYNLEVVDALIRADADIEMRTKDQLEFTPLLVAAWFGKLKMVELLVDAGADFEATDGFGANALQVSMEDNPNIPESQLESFNERRKQTYLFLEALEPVEAPEVSLLIAIQNEDLETVLAHISYGTDLNDTYGVALGTLHTAVLKNNWKISEALIKGGVDIEMRTTDMYEFTPLLIAAYFGIPEMVELLVESGADLEATDWFGSNAVELSAEDNPFIPEDELESFNESRKQIVLFLENAGG